MLLSEEIFFNRRIILIVHFSLVIYGLDNSWVFDSHLYAITLLHTVIIQSSLARMNEIELKIPVVCTAKEQLFIPLFFFTLNDLQFTDIYIMASKCQRSYLELP